MSNERLYRLKDMTKLIYSMQMSLDGYIVGPDGEIAVPPPDEEVHRFHNERIRELDAHLCGRRLYEVMTYWDTFEEENPSAADYELEFARIWRALPKIVFSTTLESVGPNARLATGSVEEEVARLKDEASRDLAVGGAGLAAACTELGLIDAYEPVVHPVVAGGGRAFFPPGMSLSLRLAETRTFGSGVVSLRYERY
jgi:dihydrofolate reductase